MLSQTFRNKRTQSIVVLVPNIANPLFAQIVSGIERTAQARGYNLLLGDTHNSPKREADYIRMVETQLADGVLQLSSYSPGKPALPRPHVKAVSIAGVDTTPFPTVRIDNVSAAKAMTEHLMSLGHKRIGVISGPADNANSILRLKGYKAALEAAGIAFDPALLIEGTFRMPSGRTGADYFASMPTGKRPTAVLSMNDEMAIGVISGLKAHGIKVPEDISVSGFDGLVMGEYSDPPLTTMAQPAADMGAKGAELLINLIEGAAEIPDAVIMPFTLVERESVAAAPQT
jgi:LacI family repressor for deo operon, udp, cdd, tsx, nupC, and nupG